eukprot:m.177793 g.177793  ORF g.177793 m.177793 type:complete len:589 (+) comp31910_c0_seq2:233-1999(+)
MGHFPIILSVCTTLLLQLIPVLHASSKGQTWNTDDLFRDVLKSKGFYGCDIVETTATEFDASNEPLPPHPLIIRGATLNWNLQTRWSSPEALVSLHGIETREIRWPVGVNQFGLIRRNATVADYILSQMDQRNGGVLFDSMLGKDGYQIPSRFKTNGVDEMLLSIGPSKLGLPFHNHAAAWQTVISGEKLFFFLPPLTKESWGHALPRERADKLLSKLFLATSVDLIRSKITEAMVELKLDKQTIGLQHCVVQPGDVIWIPCNWYHATVNIGTTLAAGGQQNSHTWKGKKCAKDLFGGAHILFDRGRAAHDITTMQQACTLSYGLQYECALQLSRAYEKANLPNDALAALQAGWDNIEGFLTLKLLGKAPASSVLFRFAESILRTPLSRQPMAMSLAAKLVERAARLDKTGENIKLGLVAKTLLLTTVKTREAGITALREGQKISRRLTVYLFSRVSKMERADLIKMVQRHGLPYATSDSDKEIRGLLQGWWAKDTRLPSDHQAKIATRFWYEAGSIFPSNTIHSALQFDKVLKSAETRIASLPTTDKGPNKKLKKNHEKKREKNVNHRMKTTLKSKSATKQDKNVEL